MFQQNGKKDKNLSKKRRGVLRKSTCVQTSNSFMSYLSNEVSDEESNSSENSFFIKKKEKTKPTYIFSSSGEEEEETAMLAKEDTSSGEDSPVEDDITSSSDIESYANKEIEFEKSDEVDEPASEFSILSSTLFGGSLETLRYYPCTTSSCFVIAVEHPVTFKFSGMAFIKVASGRVNILGYNLDPSKDFVPVYSVSKICDLCVETRASQVKNVSHCREILTNFGDLVDQGTTETILTSVKDCHVLLLILPRFDKSPVHFAGSFYKSAIAFTETEAKKTFSEYGFNILEDDDSTIKFTKIHDKVVNTTRQHSLAFVSGHELPPRIIIYGQKNVGKSVTLRYLVNRLLSGGVPRVFVLDADPGQCEFTIAGCVSLTEVRDPLIGPSYTHMKTPLKWKFVGEITLDSSSMYSKHLMEVMEYFVQYFPDEILLINTAGWVKSFGKDALDDIKKFLKPTIEVELVHQETYQNNTTELQKSLFYDKSTYPRKFIIPSHASQVKKILPAQLRDIALLTYFGKLNLFWKREVSTFNSFKPYCVSATDLAIHIINSDEDDSHKISVINGSIVALCSVDASYIWDCADNSQPKRLKPGSNFGECLGFGLVRAIDINKKLLYIITPLPLGKLQFVNTLIKGKLQLPDVVLKKQKITGKELPYVSTAPTKDGFRFDGKIKRRTYRDKN